MSNIEVYNTLTGKKDTFEPREKKRVEIFVCGPTVYDLSHIGHARTYIAFDFVVKYLRNKGYRVFYVQNITDIDDKIIRRAKEKEEEPIDLARKFEKEYMKDMKSLGVDSVDKYARATEHIGEIIDQVRRLEEKGFAYLIEGDGIYYDLSKFEEYGKLSGRTTLQAEDSVSRIDSSEHKKNKGDFCLWKFSKKGEPKWESPWGKGRPGWHIEDTAITEKYLGAQYDVHGGARGLVFPHHEAEIAQMEAVSGKSPLVKYWLHTGFLTIEGEKMSKSEGNFITIREFLKEHSPRVLRMFVASSHYRSPVDYSEKAVEQAEKNIQKIDHFVKKMKALKEEGGEKERNKPFVSRAFEKFEKAMDNDFNTAVALSSLFELMKKANRTKNLTAADAKQILGFLREVNKVLGVVSFEQEKVPPEVKKLVGQREELRKEEKFEKADQIRKKVEEMGFEIEDTETGPEVKAPMPTF